MATLLFDLDGTLIDSAIGITRCVAFALEGLGEPVPPLDRLLGWIGPPLRDSFGPLLNDPARTERAVELYRERFENEGWREHTIYPGIGEAVEALAQAGHRLAVVTAKNEPHAQRIVEHLPFGSRFETIVGATIDGSLSHKTELIAEALHRLDARPEDCWMIGDRWMDLHGAKANDVPAVGVLWGFGDEAEFSAHSPRHLARSPADLLRFLA